MTVKNQVPTNEMERELRKLYLRWLGGLDRHEDDVADYIRQFERDSRALITKLGGQAASLGALADFPVPSVLELSPKAGVIYDAMQQAAIKASIAAGLNSTDAARQMLHAGIGKNFNQLNRLARTETVSAYWKNQWDSVAGLPDIVMVWGTEFSSRTCDYCKSRNGLVVEDGDLRDHPNGRCTLIPTLRSKLKYIGTLDAGGGVSYDPKYGKPVAQPTPLPAESQPTPEQRSPLGTKRNPAAPSKAEPVHKSQPKQIGPTASEKISNTLTMYGSDSPQYKEALRRFSPVAPAKPSVAKVVRPKASQGTTVTNALNMTNAQKLQNAKIMYGSNSAQYRAALKKWGKK